MERAAEERSYRLAAGFPRDIPERRFKRPVPASVEGDAFEHPHVSRNVQRVASSSPLASLGPGALWMNIA